MTVEAQTGALVPLDWSDLGNYLPELSKLGLDIEMESLDSLLDSSNVGPAQWTLLAKKVAEASKKADGIVLLHGTDTMAYTASALSFMLQGLNKPVIITGSQIPLGELRTDGIENLITSLKIAGDRDAKGAIVREVAVYFGSHLYRGNRTHKNSTEHFEAIASPNYPPLAEAGIHIRYHKRQLWTADSQPFAPQFDLDTRVGLVKFFPGMSAEMLGALLNHPSAKVVLLETFGSGNLPTDPKILAELRGAVANGKWLVNVTQCATGFVQQGLYETSEALRSLGIIGAEDLTTEAAVTKSMVLLARCKTKEDFALEFTRNLVGELG